MRKYRKLLIPVLCLLSLIAFVGIYSYANRDKQLSYNEFRKYAENGTVEAVTFSPDENLFTAKLIEDSTTYSIPNPKSESFTEFLLANDIAIMYASGSGANLVVQISVILIIVGGVILFRLYRKNSDLIKNSQDDAKKELTITLNDIAGNTEAKHMVDDVIQFIKNPEKYAQMGAKMPRGILFYGPPGTGKTLMAKAIAGEASVPFYAMSGSDFIQMYVGVGASRIRDLFKKAKKSEKAVIFIDEIDAIGKKRGKSPSSSNDERDQTLNALLTEMSGFHERDGVIVIAATNRLDTLDDALTRPGRFDRMIEIGLPDINSRKKIIALHAKKKPLSDDVDLDDLAKSTVSFSGAMIENLLNEAAINAANMNASFINSHHIEQAFYTIIAGAQKSDRSFITDADRRITAYHEAGHAYMTKKLLPDSYIAKVTIIPSVQGAGGFSLSIPGDTLYMTKQKILSNMKVLLAGRASEELTFGRDQITTGASNDIEKVTRIMMDYLSTYGMDEDFGIFNSNAIDAYHETKLMELCREKINLLYQETLAELKTDNQKLSAIAEDLLIKETLKDEDIKTLCQVA